MNNLLNRNTVKQAFFACDLKGVGEASIRELSTLVDALEEKSGLKFIRMEMGIPGLPPSRYGVEAEIAALGRGVSSRYPRIQGVRELKDQAARFVKAFIGVDVEPRCCLPCTGSTNGSFITFMTAGRRYANRCATLFLDPGFPVHKLQLRTLGLPQIGLDIYEHRGEKLRAAVERELEKGTVSTILYSNPNNPTWICLTERELRIIGELCQKYDVAALEDLAYLGMDFRSDISTPGQPPYQPTVANYTDNWVMLISSSKLFSYAGQRVGVVAVSSGLFDRRFENLATYFKTDKFGHALIFGAAYAVSAGVAHSTQHGLAAILKAASDGAYPLLDEVKIYARRAQAMKRIFLDNGFRLVYDHDEDKPLADGFYFTVAFAELTGDELVEELLHFGVSALPLSRTGSLRTEGIRACVSLVAEEDFPELERRLRLFRESRKARSGVGG